MADLVKAQGPQDLFTITFEAGSAIARLDLVELGTNQYECIPCDSANARNVLGVSQHVSQATIATGNPVPVRIAGTTKVLADDGSVVFGDFLKSGGTDNTRVTTITASGNQQNIVGRAFASSAAANDEITMLLLTVPGAVVS